MKAEQAKEVEVTERQLPLHCPLPSAPLWARHPRVESLIREDATCRMPPQPEVWVGREAMVRAWVEGGFGSESFGRLRCLTTRANRQPAVACWVRGAGDAEWQALAVDVLRIEEGRVAEIVTFGPEVFASFGLPATLGEREPQ